MRKTSIIWGTMVFISLVFFNGPLAKQLIEQFFSRYYSSTTGQVIQSEVGSYVTYGGRSSSHVHYFPKIRYSYKINGQTNEGRRYCCTHYYGEDFCIKVVMNHPAGSSIQVFYNPKDIHDVLLTSGFQNVDAAAIIRMLIQANVVVVFLIFLWWFQIRKRSKIPL